MGHPFFGYGMDFVEPEDGCVLGRLLGFRGFGLLFGFLSGAQGFGFAQQDLAEAGWAFSFRSLFRVGALLGRADEGAVFMFMGFADCLCGRCVFGGLGCAVAVVLRGYLQAVDEDPGAAGVDAIGGQREDNIGEGELDGVGVFELRQVVGRVLRRDVGFVCLVFRRRALATIAVEIAEVLFIERG
ncbi:hypothetical protein H7849_11500 [Alloacidobacterium dinghuense]|uniref:Uncharacterized protein n=1 Tax=Alloacidobacterium dinghuense TaxID=2763107 RepID=A0A7G8BPI4_9BACT|nr:hypothetical protein [Alloacidobacterium dinghuense]QNI34454.1 hypothetical protein H7849_11500 [Alloacidobacterium dinghuense]